MIAGAVLLGLLAWWLWEPSEAPPRARISIQEALGETGGEGFRQAVAPRPFRFPTDHGPHSGFRSEWWYFTGNLDGPRGQALGFELTFFRQALRPEPARKRVSPPAGTRLRVPEGGAGVSPLGGGQKGGAGVSPWAADQIFMAHFAVTDVSRGRFFAAERLARAALGLAGAEAQPLRVWVEDWSARASSSQAFPLELRAAEGSVSLQLTLEQGERPVLHGDRGLSRKGPRPGEASYYYSLARMPARGRIALGDEIVPVTGEAWMDREWSSQSLPSGVAGWDWFALQLEDGRELMYYQLRRDSGRACPQSAGTLVEADGTVRRLGPVQLQVLGTWSSPVDGKVYPSGWRLRSGDLDLRVTPLVENQELDLRVRYWEGAVRVEGTAQGKGYVELVGY